jgi:hypothetical protein
MAMTQTGSAQGIKAKSTSTKAVIALGRILSAALCIA